MTVQLRHLRLRVSTSDGTYGTDIPLDAGLNIIRAPNTSGKSTCVMSMLYVLGLEGMLGPGHDIPLPHAMTHSIEDAGGQEHQVLESQAILQVRADDGSDWVFRRYVKHPSIDNDLISAWSCNLEQLDDASVPVERRDFYVRRAGAAQRDAGFHHFLAKVLGWSLPEVSRFNGGTAPLYMETVVPLWFVEQRRGWSALQAQTPTYFGIRDVRRRALEFVLNLDVQDRARRIEELVTIQRDLGSEWARNVGQIRANASEIGVSIEGLPERPSSEWPMAVPPRLQYPATNGWISFDEQLTVDRGELRTSEERDLQRSGQVTGRETQQLLEMQDQLQALMSAASENARQLELELSTLQDAQARLVALDDDIRRHRDLITLGEMGSDLASTIHVEDCPTCHRRLNGVLLNPEDSPAVHAVDASIEILQSQKRLFAALERDASNVVEARQARTTALRSTATDLRASIRALKDSLVAPSDTPSPAMVERRISLRRRVAGMEAFRDSWIALNDEFQSLADRWRSAVEELRLLRDSDFSDADRSKLVDLETSFGHQLSLYGFSSCPVEQVGLSLDDYMPEHEGFELRYDLSASDGIRVIWAYLMALLEVSQQRSTNHPGLLVFDEPRQQAAAKVSFAALLRYADGDGDRDRQVIFATSESAESLSGMVEGLTPNVQVFDGKIIRRI